MADRYEGGMFGGMPKPLGWDIDQVPKFPRLPKDENDNPFFTQTASGPQTATAGDRKQLEDTMTSWYKAGRPSPFKNVPQNFSAAEQGVETLAKMIPNFPRINAQNWDAMIAGTSASTNVEDRRFNDPTLYNNPAVPPMQGGWSGQAFAGEGNQLDNIIAGLNAPGGALQPVLSTPASGKIYKHGDDPIADLVAQKNAPINPLEVMLGLLGGPRLGGKPFFAPRAPPVAVDMTAPFGSMTVNQPWTSPIAQATKRAEQSFNTANEGRALPTATSVANETAAEKAQMISNALGNGVDNTAWNAPYPKSFEDAFSSYARGQMTPKEVRQHIESQGWTVDKNAFRSSKRPDFLVFDPQGNSHYIEP